MIETAAIVGGGMLARSAATSAAVSAVAFAGGLAATHALERVKWPQFQRADDGMPTFKLSVRVLAASAPGLGEAYSMCVSRQSPFMELQLGRATKETEFGEFSYGDVGSKNAAGSYVRECPWRFSETITFTVRIDDVVGGPGLRFRLRARKDVVFGPLTFEMSAGDVGEGAIDLQQRVLPACIQERRDSATCSTWSSPVMLVPLAHVQGGIAGASCGLGEPVAHVAVIFSINYHPESILEAAGACERRSSFEVAKTAIDNKIAEVGQVIDTRCATTAAAERQFWDRVGERFQPHIEPLKKKAVKTVDRIMEPIDPKVAEKNKAKREKKQALSMSTADQIIDDPDGAHKGWVSHKTNDGRTFWHHLALGPPPWEVARNAPESNSERASGADDAGRGSTQ
mmetsp:Transcript_102580/g.290480  ORF Transcript_102580/g.290480 Transcript_102580/m.290480 type:complete len:398 (-) Transcript_102580:80-1273(-)